MNDRVLTDELVERFAAYLMETERSGNTRQYYLRVLRELADYAGWGGAEGPAYEGPEKSLCLPGGGADHGGL